MGQVVMPKGVEHDTHPDNIRAAPPRQVEGTAPGADSAGPSPAPAAPVPARASSAPGASPSAQPELRSLGEYRILRRLGEGGMGAVFLGYDGKHGRQVALK